MDTDLLEHNILAHSSMVEIVDDSRFRQKDLIKKETIKADADGRVIIESKDMAYGIYPPDSCGNKSDADSRFSRFLSKAIEANMKSLVKKAVSMSAAELEADRKELSNICIGINNRKIVKI